jgi:hypothetical protein
MTQNLNNTDKHHFFIGNIFTSEDHERILRNIQKKLKKKYALKDYHRNNVFFSNMIYLGYFTTDVANLYMDNIISHLLKAISEKFTKLECEYTGFKLEFDKSYYKISLKFTDADNYLEKIIIPYLHNNAIVPIYDKKKDMVKPSIDIIYYKKSNILGDKKDAIKIQVPKNKFDINHLSLIKGTSNIVRSGTPSLHDQMTLVEMNRYNLKNV